MENIILRFCRETQGHTHESLAAELGISVQEYKELENGKKMLTANHVFKLSRLFGIRGQYIYLAALQLDLLLATRETVDFQNEKIKELERRKPT